MQSRARRLRRLWLALLSAAIGVGVALSTYVAFQGRAYGLDRNADLLVHDTALLMLHEHTTLHTAPVEALGSDDARLRLVTIDEASLHEAERDYARPISRVRATCTGICWSG